MIYEKIKKLINFFVPQKLLFKNEVLIRSIYSVFYSGNKFQCNICEKKLNSFVINVRNEKTCPNCGSLERDRKLWQTINSGFLKSNYNVLDFSPSRSLARKFKTIKEINYISTDYCGNFIADFKYDILNLPLENKIFDLICCYHILEHIENDTLAMSELYRVLKTDGTIIIQTPFKEGLIYEDFSIQSEAERLKHFGQKDHVRIYSIESLCNRLKSVGFEIEVKNNQETENNYFGFSTFETQIIAKKV